MLVVGVNVRVVGIGKRDLGLEMVAVGCTRCLAVCEAVGLCIEVLLAVPGVPSNSIDGCVAEVPSGCGLLDSTKLSCLLLSQLGLVLYILLGQSCNLSCQSCSNRKQ